MNETTVNHAVADARSENVTVIEPESDWHIADWRELWRYRDLFWFLVWRGIRAKYAQSSLGIGWAIIQPLFSMLVFTVIFGGVAQVSSDGVPYSLFSFAALVPWTYFANAVVEGTQILVTNANMIKKVYFPRLLLPLSAVAAKLLDFVIASVLLLVLMAWYRVAPNAGVLVIPLLVVQMFLSAAGLGLWLTALAIQYRDVNYGINFFVQLLMYAAPVVYPASRVPSQYLWCYALNPMVGVIEGFRSALLGTRPMPWLMIVPGFVMAVILFVSGLLYFHRRERMFADVA
ncbi:MAG: ABC transporter permease [Planctomycetaceae bacterium]